LKELITSDDETNGESSIRRSDSLLPLPRLTMAEGPTRAILCHLRWTFAAWNRAGNGIEHHDPLQCKPAM